MTVPPAFRPAVAAGILALRGLAGAVAQDPGAVPEAFRDKALQVEVSARVLTPARDPASGQEAAMPWDSSETRSALPGTPVAARFVGDDIVVLVTVTPYPAEGGKSAVLITQGQVWIKGEAGVSYRSAMSTVQVKYGERLYFFPLGVDAKGAAPIRIAIVVRPAAADKAAAQPAAPDKAAP